MSKNQKNVDGGIVDIIIKILTGALINIIVFFALTAVFSFICLKTDAAPEFLKYPVIAAGGLSGFFGGIFAVGKIRKNGLLFGATCAIPSFLIIILISSLISHTSVSAVGWITAAVMTLFSAIGGIISVNRRK